MHIFGAMGSKKSPRAKAIAKIRGMSPQDPSRKIHLEILLGRGSARCKIDIWVHFCRREIAVSDWITYLDLLSNPEQYISRFSYDDT